MINIIVVGAGGFGREVIIWLEDMAVINPQIKIAGIIDDTFLKSAKLSEDYPYPLLGPINEYIPQPHDFFVIALGNPADKLRIANILEQRGAQFFNLIHPTCTIARTAKLGHGVIMCPYSLASACTIGNFVSINTYSSIGHDAVIGDGSTLSCHVDITGYVKLGRGVFIGSAASIIPKVNVGDFATIGAGALVFRNVAAASTVYAAPAKKL